jgi:RsiW-degrading membrane proteinase PrsW (M82 family)
MPPHAALLLATVPALFWLWFFLRKDRLEPEPRVRVFWVFLLGCASAAAVLRLRPFLEPLAPPGPGPLRDLADAFLITALPEETLKLLAFVLGAGFSRELDEPMDGIVYGAAAALGFTAIENALFLFESGDPLLLFVRGFTATLGHVAFTATAAFGVAVWRLQPTPRRLRFLLRCLAFSWLAHGGYDLFLFGREGLHLVSLLVVLPLALLCLSLKLRWSERQAPLHHRSTVLGTAGAALTRK